MSDSSFIERFKYKSSTLSISGLTEVNPDRVVSKPPPSQVHGSIIKASANFILKKSNSPQPEHFSPVHSSIPSLKNSSSNKTHAQSSNFPPNSESPKFAKRKMMPPTPIIAKSEVGGPPEYAELNRSYDKKEMKEFKPYTIKDYYSIKPKAYYQLGGLGPSNVGSDDWILKKKLKEKRKNYGLNVYYINAAKLPLLPVEHGKAPGKDKQEGVRERALRFAQGIQKPPLKSMIGPE